MISLILKIIKKERRTNILKKKVNKIKVEEALCLLDMDEKIKDNIRALFSIYNVGEYIFPSVFKRLIRANDDILKSVIQHFIGSGIIKPYVQYYCPTCGMQTGSFHKLCDVDDNETYYCESCDTELAKKPIDAFIVYKCI